MSILILELIGLLCMCKIQAYASIMCGYFCIGFIDFMLAGKTLTEHTKIFSPKNFKKNHIIILNDFISNI